MRAGTGGYEPFSIQRIGTVEATVDWTLADNNFDVYLTPGSCTFDQLRADQCSYVAFSQSVAKPERVRATNVAAGTYTIWIFNFGTRDDTLSYQVVFTANP